MSKGSGKPGALGLTLTEREGPMAGSRGAWQLEIPSVCRVLVIWHLGILS